MRISDGSSDVCSSDLVPVVVARAAPPADLCEVAAQALLEEGADLVAEGLVLDVEPQVHDRRRYPNLTERQISCQATSVTIGSEPSCERSSLRSEEHTSELQSLMHIS